MNTACPTAVFTGSNKTTKKSIGHRRTDLKIQRIAPGKSVEKMLVDGELDALIHPEVIQPILEKDQRVTRLFPNYRDLEMDYYKRTGIFPIMHTTAIKQEIVDKYPWVPINLYQALEASKKAAYKRMENPRIVPLAWFRSFLEEQEELLGPDPWVYGLGEINRKALETLMQYSQEQGLIGRKMPSRRTVHRHRGALLVMETAMVAGVGPEPGQYLPRPSPMKVVRSVLSCEPLAIGKSASRSRPSSRYLFRIELTPLLA